MILKLFAIYNISNNLIETVKNCNVKYITLERNGLFSKFPHWHLGFKEVSNKEQ